MKERREYLRITEAVPVRHQLAGSLLGLSTLCEDISAGGVSFASVQNISLGAVLNLGITLPGLSKAISVSGQVVWRSEYKDLRQARFVLGVQFTSIERSDRNMIAGYVSSQARALSHAKIVGG